MIEPQQLSLAKLRQNPLFNAVIDAVAQALEEERDRYEGEPANEFARGRVCALRALLEDLKA
jgi:hypothetical protein